MNASHTLAAAALVALAAPLASAVEYTRLDPARSAVSFVFRQMNVPVEGAFKRFGGRIAFDPARPAATQAEIEIDLASIDAGSADANGEAAGKLWFDTKAHPVARFVATSVKPVGPDRYEVAGRMTIKGRTRDVVAPATLRREGGLAHFEGGFVLKRADYAIGEGLWADFGTVANEVQVRFRLAAAPR